MDVLILSRLQFAVASMFHFLFVPLTLGLSILLAIMEWKYVRTGDEEYKRMVKFWGRLFVINFVIGVLTGITLEFQFGTNWSKYSEYVGDIFGSLLAIESTLAFFLESSFLAVWIFGWDRVSKRLHAWSITIVAIASNVSAFWILAANAWMQNPVGYTIRNGRAELTDFFAVITQKLVFLEFLHVVSGAYILGGFFVMGISAYHLLKKQNIDFFTRSFRMALAFSMVFSILEVVNGHFSGNYVAEHQPAKLAAMESHWETQTYAPMALLTIPDEENERNLVELIKIPGILSFLAFNNLAAEVTGLKDIPKDERPPVALTFYPFRIMVLLGCLFPLLSIFGWIWRKKLIDHTRFLRIMLYAIPLPYLAIEMGWMVAEVGRQPWIVYGIMKTSDAVSPIAGSQVMVTLIAFTVLYSLLGIVDFLLLARIARKGPQGIEAASTGKEVRI
ncbi:cytochrome ubiquinol oxidase subunit I [candidate division LCP-89 bacterium B3_LCP]|uniref:Cytochrome ubiquinol oxidase subunit I n=1 Tax=candidate division LCP-89 bacterium B3_LCP TaxID=2012998 RepID=A0A532V4N4_UNCL8|nr:MAG: cytochrome ubiquinol oxidase subunit I [candidate division LCP-89 bacterium B3_LCP]